MSSYAGYFPTSPAGTAAIVFIAAGGLLNLVTGCFTTPLRKAINNVLDAGLRASN